jgi:peptidoglycan/xylan/chitin deacetylase (PgdA/CDA1 family)
MFYLIKTPWWLKTLYPGCIWDIKTNEKNLYLTFDDGPAPLTTPFVLQQLKEYNAKATFFCIGKNVKDYFDLYSQMIEEGHKSGNHTYDHLNGWHTKDKEYFENIVKAKQVIDSNLFRPPYGKITHFQIARIKAIKFQLKPVMWSVLSGDFDNQVSVENCFLNVTRNAKAGSIIVFHDSRKCYEKLQIVLPKVLQYFSEKGFQFKVIG